MTRGVGCAYLQTGKSIKLLNGKTVKPNWNFTCKSKNLIYLITCEGCKESYVGQTGNSLCERVRIHRQQIRDPRTRQILLSSHLDTCGKAIFKIFPFFKCIDEDISFRSSKEEHFINILKPKLNRQ